MAQDSYERLNQAMYKIQGSGVVVPWKAIEGYVRRFNSEKDLKKKMGILQELTDFIKSAKG